MTLPNQDTVPGTGIYIMERGIAWARRQAIAHLEALSRDLRLDDNERHGAAIVARELARTPGVQEDVPRG